VNTGIASALASRPTAEKVPKIATVTGSSAMLTSHWTRAAVRSGAPGARRAPASITIAATARKDSQKPALSAASGSNNSTAHNAAATLHAGVAQRPHSRDTRNAASITTVRWAGTENPDSSAYSSA